MRKTIYLRLYQADAVAVEVLCWILFRLQFGLRCFCRDNQETTFLTPKPARFFHVPDVWRALLRARVARETRETLRHCSASERALFRARGCWRRRRWRAVQACFTMARVRCSSRRRIPIPEFWVRPMPAARVRQVGLRERGARGGKLDVLDDDMKYETKELRIMRKVMYGYGLGR